eukprot:8960045-Alexandrium_andersonii.AAC.1
MFRDSVARADSPQAAAPSVDVLSSETLADTGALVRSLAEGRSRSSDGIARASSTSRSGLTACRSTP